MPKLLDIARYTKVSVSTVSKALNNSPEISKATSKRIIKAARELNYPFDESNAEIMGRAAKTIGIIAPEACSSYYSVLVQDILQILSQNGYKTFTGFSNVSPEEEVKLLRMFAEKDVDGIIMIRLGSKYTSLELEKFKKESDIIIVQIILQIEDGNIATAYDGFIVDEEYGIYRSIEYFKELGHEKIMFIGDNIAKLRAEFFLKSMNKFGLDTDGGSIFMGSERFELGGYLRMKDVLQRRELPTAIFAAYDNVAIGAMRAIKEAGLKIPKDISIIGYDDIQIARYLPISLTTVGIPFIKLAQMSAESLLNRLKNDDTTSSIHTTLKPDLYVRESTGPAKKVQGNNNFL